MDSMFSGAQSFNQNISNWNVCASDMFDGAKLMEEKHKPIIYHVFKNYLKK